MLPTKTSTDKQIKRQSLSNESLQTEPIIEK